MKCPSCQSSLAATDPVWHIPALRRSLSAYNEEFGWSKWREAYAAHAAEAYFCAACRAKREESDCFNPRWNEAVLCVGCDRPIFYASNADRSLEATGRKRLIACGVDCYDIARRARHRKTPVEQTCAVCEAMFAPRRNDALHCSSRCRQKAYRARAS